jgi:hypothetical protein
MNKVSTSYRLDSDSFRARSRAIFQTYGTNLQNWEKSIRIILIPSQPDYSFVKFDQAGAEALIVAYLCKLGPYRELFLNNIKPHVFTALHIFPHIWLKRFHKKDAVENAIKAKPNELKLVEGWTDLNEMIKDSDNWPSKDRYYFIAKMFRHAGNYGLAARGAQWNLLEKSEGSIVYEFKDCQRILDTEKRMFPEIGNWQMKIVQEVKQNKILRNLFGFPRRFTSYIPDNKLGEIYMFIPQSTIGTLTHVAITETQQYIENYNKQWNIIINEHDGFAVECSDSEIENCKNVMANSLEKEFTSPVDGSKFRMKTESYIGKNLSPYKKDVNDLGLI